MRDWLSGSGHTSRKKGSVCLDRIRVAGYDPPAPTETTWFYRAATYGIGGDQVDDPQAKTGQAWKMTVKKHQPGGKISGPLIMDQEPGLYRAVFRMKAADRTSPRRLAFLRVTGDGLVSTGLTAGDDQRHRLRRAEPVPGIRRGVHPLAIRRTPSTWSNGPGARTCGSTA